MAITVNETNAKNARILIEDVCQKRSICNNELFAKDR
jgi:hypothetical protein